MSGFIFHQKNFRSRPYLIFSIKFNAKYTVLEKGKYVHDQTSILHLIVDEIKWKFENYKLDEHPENYHLAYKNINQCLDSN